jgi:hypothetical protein
MIIKVKLKLNIENLRGLKYKMKNKFQDKNI